MEKIYKFKVKNFEGIESTLHIVETRNSIDVEFDIPSVLASKYDKKEKKEYPTKLFHEKRSLSITKTESDKCTAKLQWRLYSESTPLPYIKGCEDAVSFGSTICTIDKKDIADNIKTFIETTAANVIAVPLTVENCGNMTYINIYKKELISAH